MLDDCSQQRSRRTFLKTAGITTAGISLSGCTSIIGNSGSDSVTIKTRHYPTGQIGSFLDTHTKKFEEETGIAVEYEMMQWSGGKQKQASSMQTRCWNAPRMLQPLLEQIRYGLYRLAVDELP